MCVCAFVHVSSCLFVHMLISSLPECMCVCPNRAWGYFFSESLFLRITGTFVQFCFYFTEVCFCIACEHFVFMMLTEHATNLALHIARLMIDSNRTYYCLFSNLSIFLYSNLLPTLPSMQLACHVLIDMGVLC